MDSSHHLGAIVRSTINPDLLPTLRIKLILLCVLSVLTIFGLLWVIRFTWISTVNLILSGRKEYPAWLKCYQKSDILLRVLAGTYCAIFLFLIVERIVFGTNSLFELHSQVEKLIAVPASEEYSTEWFLLKMIGAHLLSTALFHISARPCPCTVRPRRVWPTIDVTTLIIDIPASQGKNSEEIDNDSTN